MRLQLTEGAINAQIALMLTNEIAVFATDYRRYIINEIIVRLSTKLQPIIFIMVIIKSDYMGRSLPMHFNLKLSFIFQLTEDLQIGALGARALVPAALVGR